MIVAKKSRIYIIGPFRADTEYERRQNIARAEEAALFVASKGAYYRCPHLHSAHFDGQIDDSYWINLGLDMLSECDAAYLVPDRADRKPGMFRGYLQPGWDIASKGSITEVETCKRRGIEILCDQVEVDAYIRCWCCGNRDLFADWRIRRAAGEEI
jgi:hypothetical protein